ncbi:DUF4040 family protein [Xylanimonas oleitrophica]|uniref:DUF4040 family protein n=1 Tax=Xylanimonas oleitrophica TaxID=2607479 RepID=A0A2W5WU84_9MICO|nr:DUF4040 family protein [Xylanimonas oleitrophica]PZR55039.1 DUF4040 family protein [Xylanimonas oleitrophica]
MLPVLLGLVVLLALAAPLLGRVMGREAGWPLAAGLAALAAWVGLAPPPEGTTWSVPWIPGIDVALRLRADGLGVLFLVLVLGVGALVLAYSARYLARGPHPGFYGLMTGFAAAMTLLVLTDDLIVLFVAWEMTTLCSFFLISRTGPQAHAPAVRTLLVTVGGGLCLLGAVIAVAVRTGTTQLHAALQHEAWQSDPAFAGAVAALVAVAAFTKAAQFPFHAWLPDAMVAPTPVSAYLHAAAMVKAGIYLLLRFSAALADVPVWTVLLVGIGLLTSVMGAVFALQRNDLKELLAYSTVSQLGLIVATIGIGTPEALAAASVHTLAHALFKSAAFMVVGILDHSTGTRDVRLLGGVGRAMPWTSVILVLSAASMAGLPPLAGFVSKEAILASFVEAPTPAGTALAVVVAVGAVFTFAYCARMVLRTLPGTASADIPRKPHEEGPGLLVPALLPALAGVVIGLAAWSLDDLAATAASAAAGEETHPHLALWHGLTVALALSMGVWVLGGLLAWKAARVERALDRRLFPITGVQAVAAWQRGTIALGVRVGDLTRSDAPARHLAVPFVGTVVIAAVALGSVGGLGPSLTHVEGTDWLLLAVVAAGVATVVRARSRLGAVVTVGIVGFGVALLFFTLGAADVALTQLLVEVLTVVVIVLLLRRLPRTFARPSRGRAAGAGVLAVVTGLVAAAGTWALTGRREMSPAGRYFLENVYADTGGTNVVNTILVDYRALDTLGELTVLGLTGLVIAVLLDATRILPTKEDAEPRLIRTGPLADPGPNGVFTRATSRLFAPVMVLVSLWFLLRGHNAPGGGFIAALVAASGFALAYLAAAGDADRSKVAFRLVGSGIGIAVLTGLAGLADGSFLRPLHADVLGVHLTSAVVFDVGVYLAVIGVVVAALDLLGSEPPPRRTAPPPRPAAPRPAPAQPEPVAPGKESA